MAVNYSISSILSSPLLLGILMSSLLIPTAFSDDNPLLNKICANTTGNYTQGGAFAKNMKSLLDVLYDQTPTNHGFRSATWGEGRDRAYGLALCRGDVSSDDCSDCIYYGRCKITRRCSGRDAVVWFDYCYVKYSGRDFFGNIDHGNDFILVNVDDVGESDKEKFRKAVIDLLSKVSKTATEKAELFFEGEELFDGKKNTTIYTMAQCSRDLSSSSCYECLDDAVKELPIYKREGYSVGGRVVGTSCNVRYEIYSFLNLKATN
ncbi:hypothetical protein OROGR_004979 [Orobanche gracilis]